MKWVKWIISLVILLGAEAWFLWPGEGWKFEWGPLLLFVTALGTFLAIERKYLRPAAGKQIAKADIKLFKVLHKPFHDKGSFTFFHDHDFGGAYLKENVAPLMELTSESIDFQHTFLNPKIERCRKSMQNRALKLKTLLARHSFPLVNKTDMFKVYPELETMNDIRVNATVAINDAATEFYRAYIAFYDTARSEFGERYVL